MRPRTFLPLALVAATLAPAAARAETTANAGVTVTVSDDSVTLANASVARTFAREGLSTLGIEAFGTTRSSAVSDLSLGIVRAPGAGIVRAPVGISVEAIPGGLAVERTVGLPDGATVVRRDEMLGGIAGSRAQTTLHLPAPLPVERYVLDTLAVAPGARATAHAFRAGADWRYDSGWDPVGIGDDHRGHWRSTVEGGVGESVAAPGQWIEVTHADGATSAIVMERHDVASSRVEFDHVSQMARALVDLSRDLVYTGPFEESVHVESPEETAEAGRVRVLPAGTWAMEPVWTVFGRDGDETAAQLQAFLDEENGAFERRVIFNTNNVDSNRISTGAKDDVDFATFVDLARRARAAGVTTFVLDDGWQAASGDWCPDSDACPEPRRASNPVKYAARFPDPTFEAVRAFLADDPATPEDDRDLELGLWMTPMEFHPASAAFKTNPQWACLPVGAATAGLSVVQPDSSSNEAGIGVWNPLAWGVNPEDPSQPMRLVDWIESRIDRAVTVFGATYFKFDFLVWVDCGGAQPVDAYEYREAFLAMVDRLIAKHPHVLFTIDETNDYRMFPFESVSRGATWFQNGSPTVAQALHNVWNLSPYVPGATLGQGIASRSDELSSLGVHAVMAAGLTSHLTVWRDLRSYTGSQLEQIRVWSDFYRAHARSLTTTTYPLLEDPLERRWTALQPWDAATQSGWVLAYRQGDSRGSIAVPLRALGSVPEDAEFTVSRVDPATGATSVATLTAGQLRSGELVASTGPNGYALYRITRA